MKKSYVTQTCCFIGPPDVPRCDEEKIITRVRYILKPLMANGVHYFGVGGGLGYDMAVADYLLKLRDYYQKRIRIISVLPYPDWREREGWGAAEFRRQEGILRSSDKVVFVRDAYCTDVYRIRDRKLVDESGYCISYCNRATGETADMIRYARRRGLQVYNASSWDLNQLDGGNPSYLIRYP